jgi:hypothetical protein
MEPVDGAAFLCECGYRWPVPVAHRPAPPEVRVGAIVGCSVVANAPKQDVDVRAVVQTRKGATRILVEDDDGRLYIVPPSACSGRKTR